MLLDHGLDRCWHSTSWIESHVAWVCRLLRLLLAALMRVLRPWLLVHVPLNVMGLLMLLRSSAMGLLLLLHVSPTDCSDALHLERWLGCLDSAVHDIFLGAENAISEECDFNRCAL